MEELTTIAIDRDLHKDLVQLKKAKSLRLHRPVSIKEIIRDLLAHKDL